MNDQSVPRTGPVVFLCAQDPEPPTVAAVHAAVLSLRTGALLVPPGSASVTRSLRGAVRALRQGEAVVLFPAGVWTVRLHRILRRLNAALTFVSARESAVLFGPVIRPERLPAADRDALHYLKWCAQNSDPHHSHPGRLVPRMPQHPVPQSA
jgi:hypothetical protein